MLPEMRGEGLDHVGGTGAAVGHVDEGELHAAVVFAVSDLAEARIAVKAFVLDDGVVLKGGLAAVEAGLNHGARDTGFTGRELGIFGRAAGSDQRGRWSAPDEYVLRRLREAERDGFL